MYCIKRKGVVEGRAYTLTVTLRGLILKLLNNQPKWKDKYFYVGGDIWDKGRQGAMVLVHATWNHNFNTT